MARKRRRGSSSSLLIALLVIVALGAGGWFILQRRAHVLPPSGGTSAAADQQVDPANEGHQITVSGSIKIVKPARDAQLGVSADAIALLRKVEMLQWRERCAGGACDYALEWSEKPFDSHAFRDPAAHANPARFPFVSASFFADDARLGAFRIDAAAVAAISEPVAFPMHAAQLQPNLAATFRDRDGLLYAGADPDHPAAGDLRVSYRIVAAGTQRVTGLQQGNYLKSSPAR
jgi:hypothetical protein